MSIDPLQGTSHPYLPRQPRFVVAASAQRISRIPPPGCAALPSWDDEEGRFHVTGWDDEPTRSHPHHRRQDGVLVLTSSTI